MQLDKQIAASNQAFAICRNIKKTFYLLTVYRVEFVEALLFYDWQGGVLGSKNIAHFFYKLVKGLDINSRLDLFVFDWVFVF